MLGWLAKLLDPGRDVDELARRLGIERSRLLALQPDYRLHEIAKRSGGRRTIEAPDAETKHVQRLILRRILGGLKSHPAAMGFEKGRSIVTHADAHRGRALVVRLDVMDFFTNTRADRVYAYFRFIGWNRKASRLLVKLTTRNGHLPQGAPTSPRLSNLLNHRMDARLAAMLRKASGGAGTYTRYADDLTFSVAREDEHTVRDIMRGASAIVRDEGYILHRRKKTHIQRAHQRQVVTGLVVNAHVNLPRSTRRFLRAVAHRMARGGAATLTETQLAGWQALQNMIDTQRSDPPRRARRR